MDILNQDQGLTLAQAAKLLPGNPNPSTLWRWCRQGVGGVRLEYRRVGRQIITSRDALQRFSEELTKRDAGGDRRPAQQRQKPQSEAEQVEAEADAEGL